MDSDDEARAAANLNNDDAQLREEDIAQVIDLDDLPPLDHIESDDEDQQSTSNMSGAEEVIVDDAVCSLQAHEQDCFSIAVIADRWLASGGEDDVAYLWDQSVSESDPVLKIQHADSVTSVSFNNAGTMLATADMSGKIVVTQLSDLKPRVEMNECNDLEWMFWHNSSDIIFAGDKDGMVWMWLIGPKGIAQSKILSGNGSCCTVGHLLPDGRRLLAGYADGSVRMWSLKDQSHCQLWFRSPITAIHHHVTQPVAAIGTQSGTVSIINTAQEGQLRKVSLFPALDGTRESKKHGDEAEEEEEENLDNCVECLRMAPSHPWLAVGRNDGSLCIYEVDSNTPRSIYRAPALQAMTCVEWSMDGIVPYLTVGSIDGTVRIFDARNGSVEKELGNGGDEVLDLQILGNTPLRVMTAGSGGIIRIFDLSQSV